MEDSQKVALDRAQAAGYLPQVFEIARSATVPIWWSRSSSRLGSAVLHNGTVCAIDTGAECICVTAGHVYSKYLEQKAKFSDLECQIGSVRINLEDYVIDLNTKLDLATFKVSPVLMAGSRVTPHGAPAWPPEQLEESEIVVVGGYPGLLRIEEEGRLGTPFVSMLARIAQTSSDHAAIQLNLEDAYWPDGSGGIPPSSELGGLSGGPVLRYRTEPVEYFEVAGFVYEASEEYGLVFARHASCISNIALIESAA